MDPSYCLLCLMIVATILGVCICSYPFIVLLFWDLVVLLQLTVHDSISFSSLSSPTKDSTTRMSMGSLTLGATWTGCVLLLGFSVEASLSLYTLMISAFFLVEHWLLLFVAALPSFLLVFAFAMLHFYSFDVNAVPVGFVYCFHLLWKTGGLGCLYPLCTLLYIHYLSVW